MEMQLKRLRDKHSGASAMRFPWDPLPSRTLGKIIVFNYQRLWLRLSSPRSPVVSLSSHGEKTRRTATPKARCLVAWASLQTSCAPKPRARAPAEWHFLGTVSHKTWGAFVQMTLPLSCGSGRKGQESRGKGGNVHSAD